jgi:hypothetical protein
MQNSPPRPQAGSVWRHVLILTAAALLAGCASNGSGGDFGEVRPDLVRDSIHDWVGREAAVERHSAPSHFPLIDDERELRDLAYPLIEPPYRRQKWDSVLGEYGAFKSFQAEAADRTLYFKHLMGADDRSPSSRYAQLLDDIHNDETRLPQFFATATRVIDIDAKRRDSLHYITDLPPSERSNALRRIRENAAIVSLASTRLRQRVVSYRYALEQLVVRTPSSQAATAERAINQLKADIARYDRAPTPTWVRPNSLAAND